jgi:hypothetical protein
MKSFSAYFAALLLAAIWFIASLAVDELVAAYFLNGSVATSLFLFSFAAAQFIFGIAFGGAVIYFWPKRAIATMVWMMLMLVLDRLYIREHHTIISDGTVIFAVAGDAIAAVLGFLCAVSVGKLISKRNQIEGVIASNRGHRVIGDRPRFTVNLSPA